MADIDIHVAAGLDKDSLKQALLTFAEIFARLQSISELLGGGGAAAVLGAIASFITTSADWLAVMLSMILKMQAAGEHPEKIAMAVNARCAT